jgi:hypothetical protein
LFLESNMVYIIVIFNRTRLKLLGKNEFCSQKWSKLVAFVESGSQVSPELALPYPSMPCRRATPEMALRPFTGRYSFGHLLPLWIPHAIHRMPMVDTMNRAMRCVNFETKFRHLKLKFEFEKSGAA